MHVSRIFRERAFFFFAAGPTTTRMHSCTRHRGTHVREHNRTCQHVCTCTLHFFNYEQISLIFNPNFKYIIIYRPRRRQHQISLAIMQRRALQAQVCWATHSASSLTPSSSSSSSSRARAYLGAAQHHRKAASFCRTSLQIKARVSSEEEEAVVVRRTWPFSGSRRPKPPAPWRLLPLPPTPIITYSEARRARCQRAMPMAATSSVARPWFLAAHRRSFLRRPLLLRGGHRLQGSAAAYSATCVETLQPVIRSLAAGLPPFAA